MWIAPRSEGQPPGRFSCHLRNGSLVFAKDRAFHAAFCIDSRIYGLTQAGLIFGDSLLVMDMTGQILQRSDLGGRAGSDLVIDTDRGTVWTVGEDVKRCDLDLNVLTTVDVIG